MELRYTELPRRTHANAKKMRSHVDRFAQGENHWHQDELNGYEEHHEKNYLLSAGPGIGLGM